MKYNFKKMTETAKLPTRHTIASAGVDFYSDEKVSIEPGKSAIVSTGISWNPQWFPVELQETSSGYSTKCTIALIIQSRSGYAFKKGIEASNAGVIDVDYVPHGEEKAIIHVKLYNHSDRYVTIEKGDKICQGVPQLIPLFDDVETLDEFRLGKGFGSSDEKG
jgi:dUTP pyrophosphatase